MVLGSFLPGASNFFLVYMLLRIALVPLKLLQPHIGVRMYLFRRVRGPGQTKEGGAQEGERLSQCRSARAVAAPWLLLCAARRRYVFRCFSRAPLTQREFAMLYANTSPRTGFEVRGQGRCPFTEGTMDAHASSAELTCERAASPLRCPPAQYGMVTLFFLIPMSFSVLAPVLAPVGLAFFVAAW